MKPRALASTARGSALVRAFLLVWLLYSAVSVALYLPTKYQSLRHLETGSRTGTGFAAWSTEQLGSTQQAIGIRPEVVATVQLAADLVCLLSFWGIGGLLLWKKSDTWLGAVAAYVLLVAGPGFADLVRSQAPPVPLAEFLETLSVLLTWPTFFVALYLFPGGTFVPRFARYPALLTYLLFVAGALFPSSRLLETIGIPVVLAIAAGGLASQIYRYRVVSGPDERQQTKWVVLAIGLFILGLLADVPLRLFPGLEVGTPARFWFDFLVGGVLSVLIPALIPLAIGVSILRYRLWDIDVIIRKTLVYGALTGLLGLVYAGSVILFQQLFETASGQRSPLAVVLSTLLAAALFAPLRRRVQDAVDRRFFRRKVNAAAALAAFAAAARDETDLDALTARLTGVVQETMQPAGLSLWLRR